jgi:AraC-like DNA-binding protein
VNVTIDWLHLLTLIGAAQGFLLAGVLLAHRTNRAANRLLAALMAAFTLYLIQDVYYSMGLLRAYPAFFGWSYPLPWIFGPLVYLYALDASDGERRFHLRDAVHFLPVVVVVLAGAPIYLMSGPDKIAMYGRLQSGDVPAMLRVIDPTKWVSGFAYSVATFSYLRQHRREIENSYSSTERVNLRWLVWLSAAAVSVWLLALVIGITGIVPSSVENRGDSVVALAIALLVYAIGYKGLRQPEIFHYDRREARAAPSASLDQPMPDSPRPAVALVGDALAAPGTPASSAQIDVVSTSEERANARYERYERSGLSDVEARALKASLLALMTREHPYRDPDLTLPALAERLDATPHKLSEVLNSELSQTFYDFVNGYRVEEVRRRLAAPDSRHLSVLTLAMDAGFASKSTFNQVFKKQTGQTPSTYRKAVGAE